MKKLWLVVALAALGGLASKTFADVQNIRLSGDIRIRGYFLDSTAVDPISGRNDGNDSFIAQRTRVSCEADLEDHVLVVVTLQAEGEWGADNGVSDAVGAGTGNGSSSGKISRMWGVGIAEAYVQFNEVFYTPATLKLGRQYLQYGRGLILSSVEQEYNYDAARLVLDYYPLTIDLVGAEVVNTQSFGGTPNKMITGAATGANDLLFVNARYELSDSAIKDVEAYFGWLSQSQNNLLSETRTPPASIGSSPMIVGLRADINPVDALQTWVEAAYEFGGNGDNTLIGGTDPSGTIGAFLLNAGGKFTFKDVQWVPVLNGNFIYASGGGDGTGNSPGQGVGNGQFRPWFDYADGYNGYVFMPALTDIAIFNLGASVKPYENTTLSIQGYYYMKADKMGLAGSNGNVDWGGSSWASVAPGNTGNDAYLGWELDGILGYDYSKDVRAQLVYGVFLPGLAYENAGVARAAQEVRAELNVKF